MTTAIIGTGGLGSVIARQLAAGGIGRYFAEPLTHRDIGELGKILGRLIQANENQLS